MFRTSLITLFFVVPFASGCDDGSTGPNPGPEPDRRYQAQVTGAFNRTLAGKANFVPGTSGYGGPMVAVVLRANGAEDLIVLETGERRPAVGTYPIAVSTEPVAGKWLGTFQARLGPDLTTFNGTGGEVRILESTAKRLRGTFRFEASVERGEVGIPVQVEITGSFDAGASSQ